MRREFTTRERRAEKTRARAGQGARNGLQEIPGFRSLLRLTAVCYSALDVSSFRGWCASQTSFTFDPRERFGYRFYWSTGDELGGGGGGGGQEPGMRIAISRKSNAIAP